jgi:hypothetical protein
MVVTGSSGRMVEYRMVDYRGLACNSVVSLLRGLAWILAGWYRRKKTPTNRYGQSGSSLVRGLVGV